MNIFATSADPNLCAMALDDRRLRKMILETAQILSTVITKQGGTTRYAPTHGLHPCTLWAGQTHENFEWLAVHGICLGEEYRTRWPNKKEHLSSAIIREAARQRGLVPRGRQTLFPNCTAFKSDQLIDPTVAYRLHLNWKWHHDSVTPQWTNRAPPPWLIKDFGSLCNLIRQLGCEFPQNAATQASAKTH